MFLVLSLILSRSNCILILVVSNLACSAPLMSRKRATNENEQGFSSSPKILEIQLPLKIASKQDLLAWSKYVMTLVTPKVNLTSTLKDISSIGSQPDKRVSLANSSGFKSKEMTRKTPSSEKKPGINYPARRLKEPPVQSADDKVVAYPLPVGKMKFTAAMLQDPFSIPTSSVNGPITDQQLYFEQYANFNVGDPFQQNEPLIFTSPEILARPPSAMYLPLPPRATDVFPYQNGNVGRNDSEFKEPTRLSTKKRPLNVRMKPLTNNEFAQVSPRNRSQTDESLLTFPFQAVITITRQLPSATTTSKTQQKNYFATRGRDPPNEFPSYFNKNYTLTNESGQINVILDDFTTDRKKMRKNERVKEDEEEKEEEREEEEKEEEEEKKEGEEEEEEEESNSQNVRKQRKGEKKKGAKQQQSSKRQPLILGDLLRMLGILKKLPKNTTEVSVTAPVLSILKGTNQQKIQVTFEDMLPNQERRNETFAQQTDDDDDDDDDDEEEEGGSLQALLELLPLAVPILEELSDPEADVDIADLLQSLIPLLEGLSDPEDEDAIDIPGVLVPLSQRLSEGRDGEGSDSGAILGPLIQLIAPLIGPLVGPLIGPLSRTSSGELAKSAGDSDVKSLVSAVVSGVLAGTSAGSSSASKGDHKKDTYYAQTTYDSYHPHYRPQTPNSGDLISGAIKEILGAFLKLSATSSTSSANLSGTSSSSSANKSASSSESKEPQPAHPTYGPPMRPPYYAPPTYTSPESTSSPYITFTRRQTRQKIKKF
ncbi:hypothetical protein EAI_13396 [Harpegnathos saltator]|uniref:Uncharacterized protein n=1 Tax=Harpegnathos saltator TaxID=610380 RepID=E2B955_HARSA|nr:hypothetical protein EAI_13396 [Harpegnathos saltator]